MDTLINADSLPGSQPFQRLFHHHPLPMWVYELKTFAFLEVNDAAVQKYGYSRKQFLAMTLTDIHPPQDEPPQPGDVAQKRSPWQYSGRHQHRLKGGRLIDVEITSHTLQFKGRDAVLVLVQDVTERVRLRNALTRSESELRATLSSIGEAVISTDTAGRITMMNPVAEQLTGWSETEARGKPLEEVFRIIREDTRAVVESPLARVLGEGIVIGLATHSLLIARNGAERPIANAAAPIRDAQGDIIGVVLTFYDQTQERQAQRRVEEARRFAESIVATVRQPLLVLDANLRVLSANRSFYRVFQTTPAETQNRLLYELGNRQWDIPELRQLLETILPQNTTFDDYVVEHDFPHIGRRTMLLNARQVYRQAGKTELILLAIEDITERNQAEQALRQSEERYRHISELISDYVYAFRVLPDGTLQGEWLTESFTRVFGYNLKEVRARGGWRSMVLPDDLPLAIAHAQRVVSGQSDICEMRFVTRAGEAGWIRDYAVPVWNEEKTRVVRIYGAAQDITERKQLEAEKEKLAAQFYQAQKMDSIGKLAGGIAHDFNNLLVPITGYAELGMMQLPPEHKLYASFSQIKDAAERAASLTRQILAFSRRQMLELRTLDLNQVVHKFQGILQHLMGEDITLATHLAAKLHPIKADKGQLEQVLLNLAVNARDAMPNGGTLTIETANVRLDEAYVAKHVGTQPGPHVLLAVSDTGQGIDAATQERIFEPFFTTKEMGRGTGLGLATVFGIVKQHGGNIWVYSEPGRGTTFKIYLPASGAPAPSGETEPAEVGSLRGTETVLVVEDETGVRQLVYETLQAHGYQVLEAENGAVGLEIATAHKGPIHLLLTDVIMPTMNGRELYEKMRRGRSGLKVLYMSGYTDNVIAHYGVLEEGTAFLQKPFAIRSLLQKVRAVLE